MKRMVDDKIIKVTGNGVEIQGSITGDEIIENMSGYSFSKGSETTNLTREFVYAGIVKNGNKITLVIAINLTRTGTVASTAALGKFVLPSDILSKIYPSTIGGYDYVSVGKYGAWQSDTTSKDLSIYSQKAADGITFSGNTDPINALTANTKYYCRIELTILLSDNLAA